jgi:dTDP-4-amino-4,6-dideoxygalactose transaminase
MSQLALLGGTPVLAAPLPPYRSMGEAEKRAVVEVVESGCLSGFYGSPGEEFFGGPKVRAFEAAWRAAYGVAHAVTVNSATSGLVAAMGAAGVGPGDEVVVPATSMSATAVACLFYGGIPVFADIEDETFCASAAAVERALTPRTRAIVVTNLFGHPAELAALRALADRRGVFLIEDSAQAPAAFENGRRAGTAGHIGVYSLNYHKHIHTGEGGVCVTESGDLAKRLELIRNHAENGALWRGIDDLVNMVGLNLRMTELEAAIGIEQLAPIDAHVSARVRIAERLSEAAAGLDGLRAPKVRAGCTHNYYCWTLRIDARDLGVPRDLFAKALAAEGFPNFTGYVPPLHRLPLFRRRVAIGRDGFPFTLTNRSYADGLTPVAERLHREDLILFEPCAWAIDEATLDALCEALRKVHRGLDALRGAGIAA